MKIIILQDEDSERSYDYAETHFNSTTARYGLNSTYCHGSLAYEYQRVDFCSTCYCICDDDLDQDKTGIVSDRKFYIKPVKADIENN